MSVSAVRLSSPSRSRRSTPSPAVSAAPRAVQAVLKREGVHVGRERVVCLMRQAGIAGISLRGGGFTRCDPKAILASDLVERDFTAPAPNRLWVGGLAVVVTGVGRLWLSVVRDVFSRRVVAWGSSAYADAGLVLSTFKYAFVSREVEPGQLIHHADHGCPYTSVGLLTRLLWAGVRAFMGSVGGWYDSVLAESVWILVHTECICSRVFTTRAEVNLALFGCIDGFCSSRRIRKRLGYLSPVGFGERYDADQATTERTNLRFRQPALAS
ncbi:DDE-type integrase/transposase/recombinase [Streptomyces sp. NPDC006997]|uniref:DDE-type integrase/transposase/recombinase n=1 Tax=Streptomyces sp. NPDC006997 TaxID=3155356 RepID=UPI0033FADF20